MPRPRSAFAPTPGRRRRRKPAGSMRAASARSQASRSASKSAATTPACALVSQTADAKAPFTARLGEIMVIAQIYQPKLLIAEFKAPATLSDRGQPPSLKVNWSLGHSSVYGLPDVPQRASIEFNNPSIDRVNGPVADAAREGQPCRTARPHRRRLGAGQSGHRNRVADSGRQRAGSAPAAGCAVRCRRPDQAERPEGFFAKAVAGTVSGKSRRRAAMSRSCGRGFSRAIWSRSPPAR